MANFKFLQNIQELIAKYLRGELSDGENAELQEWIDASPANKEHFEELINSEKLMEKMRIWQQGREGKDRGWQKIEQRLEGRSKQLWFRLQWTKMAAAVLFLVLGLAVWFLLQSDKQKTEKGQVVQKTTPANDVTPGGFKAKLTLADGSSIILDSVGTGKLTKQGNTTIINKDGQVQYATSHSLTTDHSLTNTLSTSNGQTYKAILSDGSAVWLNAGSSIRYPVVFNEKERKVEITGEVYFEVAKDARRPFKVVTSTVSVEVLGTKFNVNTYSDESLIKTTLLEGSVKITSSGNGQQAMLKPGQQAQLATGGKAIKVTNDIDTEEVLAWKDGKFIFNDLDLTAAMRQIERWYDVQVSYGYDATKKPLRVNGEITRYTNVSKVLDIMKSTGWLDFRIEGKKITILSK